MHHKKKVAVFSMKGPGTLFMSSHKSPLSLQMALRPKPEAALVKEPDLELENPKDLVRSPLKRSIWGVKTSFSLCHPYHYFHSFQFPVPCAGLRGHRGTLFWAPLDASHTQA